MVHSVDLKPVCHEPVLTTEQRSEVPWIPSHSRLSIPIHIPFSLLLILIFIPVDLPYQISFLSRKNSHISLLHLLVL